MPTFRNAVLATKEALTALNSDRRLRHISCAVALAELQSMPILKLLTQKDMQKAFPESLERTIDYAPLNRTLKMRIVFAFLSILSLAVMVACQTVATNVESFSELSADIAPQKVYIEPFSGFRSDDLRWRQNAEILATVLSEKGFEIVERKRDATLIAFFGFAIDRGQRVTSTYSIPQYGVTGYSGAYTSGNVYGNSFSANTTYTPTYGVTGYSSGIRSDVVYTRSAQVDMVDRKSGKMVYTTRAMSSGTCATFTAVAPFIIRASLSKFPAPFSGRVDLTGEVPC